MYANDKAMAERWEKHTPKGKKLPEKVKKQTNKNAELKSGFKRNSMDVKTQEPSDIQKLAQAAAHRNLAKLASLGGLQAAYVADAAGADASERANALAGDRARKENSNLIDDLFGQGADAQRMINKRKRHANAAFAESDAARLVNVVDPSKLITKDHDATLTGLAMVSGKKNKDKEDRVLDRYKEIIRKYQEPVDMDGKRTSRETPFHLQSQGALADADMDVAGHTQQRKEHPINYWLNPLDRTGPINEVLDRGLRRINAAIAAPDSAIGRLGMGVGNAGTLGLLGLLAGGEDAQNKLRRSAVDNRIFDEHSMPSKSKDDDKKSEKEGSEKQANLANIIKALKLFGKRTLAPAAGTGLVSYGIGKHKGYGQGFESGQDSIKDMNLKEIMDLAMPKLEVAKQASTIQELAKEAGKRGLWDNVHAKRKRGEKPAKKGDKDYPDEKSWKKTTKKAFDMKKLQNNASELLKNKAVRGGLVGAGVGGLGGLAAELALPRDEDDETSRLKLPLLAAIAGGAGGSLTGAMSQGGFKRPGPLAEQLDISRLINENQMRQVLAR